VQDYNWIMQNSNNSLGYICFIDFYNYLIQLYV
jgi:hypothetical protein